MAEVQSTEVSYRPVVGFPGYRVGEDGSVWSLWRRVGLGPGNGTKSEIGSVWKKRKTPLREGYLSVRMRSDRGIVTKNVHTLVLEAFVGPRPDGLVCRHGDDDRTNAKLTNLKWGTHKENTTDMVSRGRGYKGPPLALGHDEVRKMRCRRESGETYAAIAESFGVSLATAHTAINGRRGYGAIA